MIHCPPVIKFSIIQSFLACLSLLFIIMPATGQAQDADGKIYELRLYTANPGKLPDLNARFRDHTLALFEKHGIENLYYWTVSEGAEGDDAENLLIYLVAHESKAAADAAWPAFLKDPEWQQVARKSEENGRLLAGPPQSIYMYETDFSPAVEAPNTGSDAPARLFELRKYNTGVEGLPGTVDRFRGGEADLFSKHGMPGLQYWAAADNTSFIYLLAHKDRETSRQSWQGFFADFQSFFQEYNARKAEENPDAAPQGGGPRMTSEIRFLVPTDYSPRK